MPPSAKFWAIAILAWAGLAEQRAPALVDVTAESGLGDFINVQGSPAKNHIIETMGGGTAFLDYDRDGNLDILLVRGSTVERYREGGDLVCGLYRGDGRGHFQDVTAQSGMKARGWGMGVVVGDYDNDGWDDIYVTGYGPDYLFRNRGDRTFAELGVQAGVQDPRWSVGAAFADIDRDGDLDLYVCNYLEYDLERLPKRNAFCTYRGFDVFCGPRGLPGSRDALFLNTGNGKFRDVTIERGIDPERLYGMGVVFGDYDNDGWPDIFVANDLTPNLLYHNRGKGEFEELAVPAGVAFDENGIEEGYMGVDFGDYNNDGWLDLHYTNSSYQTDQLAVNNSNGSFVLKSHPLGLGEMTWLYVGWGTFFADLDNDRWEDIFTVNGHLYPQADHFDMGLKYKQRKLLFMNQAGKKFREAGAEWGPALIQPENSRGAAFGDYDNDGDLDVLVNNLDAPPTLLRNDGGNRNRWLIVHCLGKQSNRSAIGTRLVLRSAKLEQIREIKSGGSYASHNDVRVHFGLGSIERIDELEIRWPSGKVEKRQNVKPNQILVIEEGNQGS
jgi:hypothetical protein